MLSWIRNLAHALWAEMTDGHEERVWLTWLVVSEPINGTKSAHFGSVEATMMCRCGHCRSKKYKTALFGSFDYAKVAGLDLANQVKAALHVDVDIPVLNLDVAVQQMASDNRRGQLTSVPVAGTSTEN